MKQLFFLYANMVTIQIFGAILMGIFQILLKKFGSCFIHHLGFLVI